jgi:hypothetical protein
MTLLHFKKLKSKIINIQVVAFESGVFAIRRGHRITGYTYLYLGLRRVNNTGYWLSRSDSDFQKCVSTDLEQIKKILMVETQSLFSKPKPESKDFGEVVNLELELAQYRLAGSSITAPPGPE